MKMKARTTTLMLLNDESAPMKPTPNRQKSQRPIALEKKGSAHMKIPPLGLAFVASLLTGCVSPESGIKSDPATALRQLDQERIQAQISADAAALDRLYAEDFIGIGPSGTVRTKAQVIADFTSGSL